jgi:hypothetical protein
LVRWRSSAKDLEDCPAEAEVEQAHVRDHKQHKDQHYDEVVDQLRAGGIDNLAEFSDRLPNELDRVVRSRFAGWSRFLVDAAFGARAERPVPAVLVLAPEAAAATPAGSKTFADSESLADSALASFVSFVPVEDASRSALVWPPDNSAELGSGSTSSLSATL